MTTAYDAPHDELDEPYWSKTRIGLAVMVVLMVLFWGWIYIFAPRDNPDRLATRSFAREAETICAPAQEAINALPLATRATDPADRAQQVAAGTAITVDMVDALKNAAGRVTDDDDGRILDAWFDDWDAYILDRQTYIVTLEAADDDTPTRDLAFTLTERAAGGIYTRRIDGLGNVNDMSSCHVPGDV